MGIQYGNPLISGILNILDFIISGLSKVLYAFIFWKPIMIHGDIHHFACTAQYWFCCFSPSAQWHCTSYKHLSTVNINYFKQFSRILFFTANIFSHSQQFMGCLTTNFARQVLFLMCFIVYIHVIALFMCTSSLLVALYPNHKKNVTTKNLKSPTVFYSEC